VNAPGKSPSVRRVVVIAGALTLLASAMTPAIAGQQHVKAVAAKKHNPPAPRPQSSGGSGAGPLSLEWSIASSLRP
jgi:hypothetical protein